MEGDFQMGMENYEEAEKNYEASTKKKPSFTSYYNAGVAEEYQISSGAQMTAEQAMQGPPEDDPKENEAVGSYRAALNLATSAEEKSFAYHNMANAMLKNQQTISIEKLEEAIEIYKDAIKTDPKNLRSRQNLAVAQAQLDQAKQQQQQQQDSQEGGESDSEQQEQQEQEEQENQEQEQEQQENQQQQEQEKKEDEEKKEQEKKEQERKEKATKSEMEKILEMVDKEDKEVQQKVKMKSQKNSKEKKKKW